MSRTQRLTLVLVLNLGLVAALVAVGLTAHSLAVLAEGGDYLLDAAGVAVALLAIRLSARSSGQARPPGRPAPTDLAALFNCGWLFLLEVLVAAAAVERLIAGTPEVHGLPVLVVSGVAALTMTIGALVLRADTDNDDGETGSRDLSVAAVLLDTVADAAAAAGVAATGGIILATGGWYWLDPAVALVIAMIVGYHAAILLHKILRRVRLRLASGGAPAPAGPGADRQCLHLRRRITPKPLAATRGEDGRWIGGSVQQWVNELTTAVHEHNAVGFIYRSTDDTPADADRDGLTAYLRFPAEHHHRIRHSNFIERTFGETRRRTKVIGRLPGETSCLSLVWAVLDRASRGWRGLTMTTDGLRLLLDLRRALLQPPRRLVSRTASQD